jgi:hypothetical protein
MIQTTYNLSDVALEAVREINGFLNVEASRLLNLNTYFQMFSNNANLTDMDMISDSVDRCNDIRHEIYRRIQALEPNFKVNSGSLGILDTHGNLKPEFRFPRPN